MNIIGESKNISEINIDSRNRTADSASSSNFTVNLNNQLRRIRSLTLYSCEIPHSYYVFTSLNNRLIITQGATANIDIPAGNYSASSLATTLQQLIIADATLTSDAWSVAFNANNYHFTITSDTVFSIDVGSTLAPHLGYPAPSLPLTGQLAYESTVSAYLNIGEYLMIKSNRLSSGLKTRPYFSNNESTNLFKIPQTASGGGVILFNQAVYATYKYSGSKILDDIDVELVDANGNTIDMNGVDWSFTIRIETD